MNYLFDSGHEPYGQIVMAAVSKPINNEVLLPTTSNLIPEAYNL
jgi:hypothetical protein